MQWLKNIINFFETPPAVDRPTPEQVHDKVEKISAGEDRASLIVNQQQREYKGDLLKIKKQAKIIIANAGQEIDAILAAALANRDIYEPEQS